MTEVDEDFKIQEDLDGTSVESCNCCDNEASLDTVSASIELEEDCKNQSVWYDLTKQINDLESDEDVVSLEESEKRLNILCMILAFILIITSSCFTTISYRLFDSNVIFWTHPPTPKNEPAKPRVPHLLLMAADGSITPYAWSTNQTTLRPFPKLGYGRTGYYGGFCTKDQVHVFKVSNYGGMTIIDANGKYKYFPGLHKSQTHHYKREGGRVVINQYIWLMGMIQRVDDMNVAGLSDYDQQAGQSTAIWSSTKNRWYSGPNLPLNFNLLYGCAVSLDRNKVLLIGGSYNTFEDVFNDVFHEVNNKVIGYDFRSKNWTKYNNLPIGVEWIDCETDEKKSCRPVNKQHVSCAVQFNKSTSQIMVATSAVIEDERFQISNIVIVRSKPVLTLWNFDILNDQWIGLHSQTFESKGELGVIQGILHYFLSFSQNSSHVVYFFNESEQSWKPKETTHFPAYIGDSGTLRLIPCLL